MLPRLGGCLIQLLWAEETKAPFQGLDRGQTEIVLNGGAHHQRLTVAILGHIGHPVLKGLVRVADGNIVSGEGYLAAVHREQAVCRLTDLTDAGVAQTTEPKNLTLVQVKGYVLEMVGADILQRQGHLVFELGSGVAPVPVVKNVQNKSLTDVAAESKDLVARAKEGRLKPEEYSNGTFSISNLGMFGIGNFTAIINAPEAAILSVSSVRKTPVVITDENGEDTIAIRPMMNIQLSVDHRLIDGLLASQFVEYMKQLLENPVQILM